MKRITACLLLLFLSVAWSMPAEAKRDNSGNSRQARKAVKQQRKLTNRQAKKQRKAMKRYQKAQRKAAKQQQHRRT
jgi:hypothetical protein